MFSTRKLYIKQAKVIYLDQESNIEVNPKSWTQTKECLLSLVRGLGTPYTKA